MKLKYYCLVAFVKSEVAKDIKKNLDEIANSEVKFIDTPTIFLATFESAFEPLEIKNYINQVENKIFFVFEVNKDVSAVNIPITSSGLDYYSHLFKHIEDINKDFNIDKIVEFESDKIQLTGSTNGTVFNLIGGNASGSTDMTISRVKIDELSHKERMEKINFLIDKGYNNLTESDKELLQLLSKKT